MSRSTWACELKYAFLHFLNKEVQSRSTWACELKCQLSKCGGVFLLSRSTWACELKWPYVLSALRQAHVTLHVSVWVEILGIYISLSKNSVTLHVSVWVEILCQTIYLKQEPCHAPRERVSWNIFTAPAGILALGHAPRERVSWNVLSHSSSNSLLVTLHVSVWVEILYSVYDRWP